MMLNLLVEKNHELSVSFTRLFSKVNFVDVNYEHPFEAQVPEYLPFLKHYMQTYSELLLRRMGDKRLSSVYLLPLEAERISKHRIPNLVAGGF